MNWPDGRSYSLTQYSQNQRFTRDVNKAGSLKAKAKSLKAKARGLKAKTKARDQGMRRLITE